MERRGPGYPDTPSSQSRIQETHRNHICRRPFSIREKLKPGFSNVLAPEGIDGSLKRDSCRGTGLSLQKTLSSFEARPTCVVHAITTNFNLRIRGTHYLPGGFCCADWSLPLIAGG